MSIVRNYVQSTKIKREQYTDIKTKIKIIKMQHSLTLTPTITPKPKTYDIIIEVT